MTTTSNIGGQFPGELSTEDLIRAYNTAVANQLIVKARAIKRILDAKERKEREHRKKTQCHSGS